MEKINHTEVGLTAIKAVYEKPISQIYEIEIEGAVMGNSLDDHGGEDISFIPSQSQVLLA